VVGQVALDQRRELRREPQLDALRTDIPAHNVQRFGVEPAARIDDVGPAGANTFGTVPADRDHRGGSVTEHRRPDQTRYRRLDGWKSQRADLDGHQNRDVVGRTAQVVV